MLGCGMGIAVRGRLPWRQRLTRQFAQPDARACCAIPLVLVGRVRLIGLRLGLGAMLNSLRPRVIGVSLMWMGGRLRIATGMTIRLGRPSIGKGRRITGSIRRGGRIVSQRLMTQCIPQAGKAGACCFTFERIGECLGKIVIVLGRAFALSSYFGAVPGLKVLGGRIGLRLRRHQDLSI